VLLEIADGTVAVSAAPIVSTLDQYFEEQRGQVLAARATPRLVWPATGPVTSHYGLDHPLGIDIGQFEGPIVAATDGVVIFAGGNPCCSYGYYVVLEGVDGTGTLYAHLSSIGVSEGQRVRQGQALGEVGCTGTCFGTHLHFEVFEAGARLDPMRYLP
jgi:murein DD-endopeptidase MepM/ murein hydrolase activator NlpD